MQYLQSTKTTNQMIKQARQRLSVYENYQKFEKLTVLDREFFVYGDNQHFTRNATIAYGCQEVLLSALDSLEFYALESIVRRVGIKRTCSNLSHDERGTFQEYQFVFNRPVLKRKLDTWMDTRTERKVYMRPDTLQITHHKDCPFYVVVDVSLKTKSPYMIDFKGDLVAVTY